MTDKTMTLEQMIAVVDEVLECDAFTDNLMCRVRLLRANLSQPVERGEAVALNVRHPKCHEAANAFWNYWNANGETHKRGYYESTWGAINAALRMVGVRPHDYGNAPPPDGRSTCYGDTAPPPAGGVPDAEPPLAGRWHHGNGYICCGSFRIAREDWEAGVCSAGNMREQVMEWMCNALNAAMPSIKPFADISASPSPTTGDAK